MTQYRRGAEMNGLRGIRFRTITAVGASIGITFPPGVLSAYGLEKGMFVEIEPREEGILVKPVRMVSALEAEGKQRIRAIIDQYRPALEAMAKHDKSIT